MGHDLSGDRRPRAHVATLQLRRQSVNAATFLLHRDPKGWARIARTIAGPFLHVYHDVLLLYIYINFVVDNLDYLTDHNQFLDDLYKRADDNVNLYLDHFYNDTTGGGPVSG